MFSFATSNSPKITRESVQTFSPSHDLISLENLWYSPRKTGVIRSSFAWNVWCIISFAATLELNPLPHLNSLLLNLFCGKQQQHWMCQGWKRQELLRGEFKLFNPSNFPNPFSALSKAHRQILYHLCLFRSYFTERFEAQIIKQSGVSVFASETFN